MFGRACRIRRPGHLVGSAAVRIEGSGAIVSGGASGLGAAVTRALHARGASVTLVDLNEEKGEELVSELGDRARFVKTDVTDEAQVEAAVDAAGDLRLSFACAGVGWAQRTVHAKHGAHHLQPFETVVRVNLIGTFNLLRLAGTRIARAEPAEDGERGVHVSTASIAAFDGQIGQIAYSASKGGVVAMTLPAARDLASLGIRVNTIAPGLFDTPLLAALPEPQRRALGETIPFPPRLGRPEEYAALALHIVENPMINGETIRLDGALRMAPR
jgi:3-hydroxyacyl-CoA dehydrogenase / 3-hydroxy-2-methylbutyryl-CoA dehydrogenase